MFIELQRRGYEVYYYQNGGECDFIVRDGARIKMAIQVSQTLSNQETRQREVRGLEIAIIDLSPEQGLIVTEYEEGDIRIENRNVKILPVWEWCLLPE